MLPRTKIVFALAGLMLAGTLSMAVGRSPDACAPKREKSFEIKAFQMEAMDAVMVSNSTTFKVHAMYNLDMLAVDNVYKVQLPVVYIKAENARKWDNRQAYGRLTDSRKKALPDRSIA